MSGSWEEGLHAYRQGRFFEAHEAWEELWRRERDPEQRMLLQALVQLAAAMHKLSSGIRPAGAPALLGRAADKLARLDGPRHGVDPQRLGPAVRALQEDARRCLEGGPVPSAPDPCGVGSVPEGLPSARSVLDKMRARLVQPGADAGLSLLFDGLVLLTRLRQGRVIERHEAEMRGLSGAINYDFTGPGGACWHAVIRPGYIRFFRGKHAAPLATVSMGVEELFRLLTGKSSTMTSQMSGRVRIRGDGHAGMIVGSMLAQLRSGRQRAGGEGRFYRAWTDAAARLSSTGLRFGDARRHGAHG